MSIDDIRIGSHCQCCHTNRVQLIMTLPPLFGNTSLKQDTMVLIMVHQVTPVLLNTVVVCIQMKDKIGAVVSSASVETTLLC